MLCARFSFAGSFAPSGPPPPSLEFGFFCVFLRRPLVGRIFFCLHLSHPFLVQVGAGVDRVGCEIYVSESAILKDGSF